MLSFFLCVGFGAARAAHEHFAYIDETLAQRSFLDASAEVPRCTAMTLHARGDCAQIVRGEDWHLLRSSLARRPLQAAEAEHLRRIHRSLQGCSPYKAQLLLSTELQRLEETAAWVAWSEKHQSLIALRDPFGKVPLYLYALEGGYVLTNTRLALEPWLASQSIVSDEAIASLLVFGMPPTNRDSVFAGLERVEPGGLAHISTSHAPIHQRWWHWQQPVTKSITRDEAIARYRTLLCDAITRERELHTVVLELSGGMDSSSLLAALRHLEPSTPIHALNYAHGEEDEERQLARQLCRDLDAQLIPWPMARIPERYFPDPHTGGSLTGTLRALAPLQTPAGLEVYSGHGADNLFTIHREDMDRMARELSPWRLVQHLQQHRQVHGRLPPSFLSERLRGGPTAHELRDRHFPWLREPLASLVTELDRRNLLENPRSLGRQGMVYGRRWANTFELADPGFHGQRIQYRFPFFDLPLIRFIASLPAAPFLYNKHIARAAWAHHLPTNVAQRPKSFDGDTQGLDTFFSGYDPEIFADPDLPAWLDIRPLQVLSQAPEKFPRWIYPSGRAILDLLQWQRRAPHHGRLRSQHSKRQMVNP